MPHFPFVRARSGLRNMSRRQKANFIRQSLRRFKHHDPLQTKIENGNFDERRGNGTSGNRNYVQELSTGRLSGNMTRAWYNGLSTANVTEDNINARGKRK